jgi:hypothetical protein
LTRGAYYLTTEAIKVILGGPHAGRLHLPSNPFRRIIVASWVQL